MKFFMSSSIDLWLLSVADKVHSYHVDDLELIFLVTINPCDVPFHVECCFDCKLLSGGENSNVIPLN
jgi:hypothetical protein